MPLTDDDAYEDGLVVHVSDIQLRLAPGRWDYAEENRDAIMADWARRTSENAALFNGRFFLLTRWSIDEDALTGTCVETDYASYLHWRAAGFPTKAWNAFAMAALHVACGRLLVGRMAGWTANAGLWYPPAGSIDGEDVRADGAIDVAGNIRRELGEEVGLDVDLDTTPGGWTLVLARGRLAMFRRIDVSRTADEVEASLRRHLAAEAQPELDDVAFLSGPDDLAGRRVPSFLPFYVRHAFGAG